MAAIFSKFDSQTNVASASTAEVAGTEPMDTGPLDTGAAASCNERVENHDAGDIRGPVAGKQMLAVFGPAENICEANVLRMNSVRDAAVVDLEDGCGDESRPTNAERRRVTAGRTFREELRRRGGFAGGTLTTRDRIQHAHDRDIGRWGCHPMKTKLLLALASIATLMSMGCVAAAPRYHTYSLPKYQASVEVQAPIGDKPEVVARITFGELGGGALK